MNPTDKAELQMEISDADDGGAIATLPNNVENPQAEDNFNDEPVEDVAKQGEPEEEVEIDREAVRVARRDERKQRKLLHREKEKEANHLIAALKKQNEFLAERLSAVEKKTTGAEFARIDKSIDDAATAVEYSKLKLREAMAANDGNALTEAQEMWYESKRKLESLQILKQNASKQQSQVKTQISAPDPMVQKLAAEWLSDNTWYDPAGGDEVSEIAQVIDKKLTAEGWNPATADYWDELDERLEQYIPQKKSVQSVKRRQTVMSSGKEATPAVSSNQFRLSPERVAALKESGAWNNPEKKMKMIKRYMEFDKQNKGRN